MHKSIKNRILGIVIFLLGFFTVALSQESELYKLLFAEPTKKITDLKRQNADLMAPTSFSEATTLYNKALEDFRKGREAAEVRKRLNEMNEALKKVDLALWNGKAIFKETLKAREDALNARASEVTGAEFNKAEETFKDAGEAVEIGDTNKARQKANDAVNRYRDSELNAIKLSVIGPVRDAINAAAKNKADELAPKTFANAKSLLTLAEETLNSNRYAVAEATEKAEKAGYEARHAVQLTRYLKEKKRTPEEIALYYEESMAAIGKELGFAAAFDTVLQKPTQNMISAIKSLKDERTSLLKDIKERDLNFNQAEQNYQKQINTLLAKAENQKQAFQEKEADLQGELLQKQRELEAKQKREAKIAKVREMFNASEASVVLDGTRLIIRMLGLSFPSGKSIIQPDYFGLLSKVERALREYPNSKVIIEGHTDNIGDERYNERLSAQRAEAVQTYLVANNAAPRELLEAVGYGESKPVANNETAEGRSQNRRIDVVIAME